MTGGWTGQPNGSRCPSTAGQERGSQSKTPPDYAAARREAMRARRHGSPDRSPSRSWQRQPPHALHVPSLQSVHVGAVLCWQGHDEHRSWSPSAHAGQITAAPRRSGSYGAAQRTTTRTQRRRYGWRPALDRGGDQLAGSSASRRPPGPRRTHRPQPSSGPPHQRSPGHRSPSRRRLLDPERAVQSRRIVPQPVRPHPARPAAVELRAPSLRQHEQHPAHGAPQTRPPRSPRND